MNCLQLVITTKRLFLNILVKSRCEIDTSLRESCVCTYLGRRPYYGISLVYIVSLNGTGKPCTARGNVALSTANQSPSLAFRLCVYDYAAAHLARNSKTLDGYASSRRVTKFRPGDIHPHAAFIKRRSPANVSTLDIRVIRYRARVIKGLHGIRTPARRSSPCDEDPTATPRSRFAHVNHALTSRPSTTPQKLRGGQPATLEPLWLALSILTV